MPFAVLLLLLATLAAELGLWGFDWALPLGAALFLGCGAALLVLGRTAGSGGPRPA